MKMAFLLVQISVIIAGAPAWAARLKAEAGLGFTNNANLTTENRKSDSFLKLLGSYGWETGRHASQIRLGYTDFFEVNSNDLFSWKISDRVGARNLLKGWFYKGGLFGRHYTAVSPGITEESFSHVGIEGGAEKVQRLNARTSLTWGPEAELRKYIENSDRTDLTLNAAATADYDARADLIFGGFGNLGFIFSNQSEYSRMNFELGGSVDYNMSKDWLWLNEFSYRHTSFTSRTVNTTTETSVSRGRKGAKRTSTSTANETFSGFILFSQMSRSINAGQSLSGDITWMSQDSLSGLQDYSSLELFLKWTMIF